MPERSSVSQVSQIGVEATPGTAVAATRRLGALSLSPSMTTESEPFRPEGMKFPTLVVQNKEFTEVSGEGVPTFEEVIVPLSGAMTAGVVAQVMDGATATSAYEWTFSPSSTNADNPKTFTLERGEATTQAERFAHLLFTEFGLEISRSGVSMSCSGFAKEAQKGVTPTTGLSTPTALTPITPGMFSVYMAPTQAGLSTGTESNPAAKMGRVISANPSVEDRFTQAWFVNQAEQSFTAFVESPDGVSGTFGLTVEADAAGMALLDNLRAGDTRFVRIEALGPVLYNAGTKPNLRAMFRWDMAVKVANAEGWSDEDGIYAIPWELQPVHDSTWGRAMQVTVRNKVASL